jgi:MoaA/NifB/PqqE/SkfB family radical SAM enzyme
MTPTKNLFSGQNIPSHFCTIPWSSIEINNLGYYRVCCVSNSIKDNQGIGKDENGEWKHVLKHDIIDSLDSTIHREIRAAQLAGEQHSNCVTCWLRDKSTVDQNMSRGRRLFHSVGIHKKTGDTFPQWEDVQKDNDLWKKGPISLDLKLGNLCNLACAHCDPINSSQWVDMWEEFTHSPKQRVGTLPTINFQKKPNNKYEIEETKWMEDPRWNEQFKKLAPQLTHIYVTGGEPMLVPWHQNMLEYLTETGYSKNIVLEYDTNMTVINNKIFNYFENFKEVVIRASIDGIEDTYSWVRWPGDWNKVSGNIIKYKKFILVVTGCVMPYNAWNVVEAEKWALENGISSAWRFINTPSHLNLRFFPQAMKKELIELYKTFETPETKKCAIYLEQSMGEENPEEVLKFIRWADFLSTKRGVDWRVQFPRLAWNLKDFK